MHLAASRAVRLITSGLAILFSLLLLPPWLPAMPAGGLDPSWTSVLSQAFNYRWQFGTEIVMTYGPYGFLVTNLFDPANYAIALAFWIVLACLVACSVLCLAERRPGLIVAGAFLVLLGLRASIVAMPPWNGQVFGDPVFFVLPLLLLALYLRAPAGSRWLIAPLLAVVALSGLIKFTFALLALPIVALIDVHRWTRRQFVPLHLITYVAFLAVFFALAGQRLANLPAYARTSLQIASGYTGAMQMPGAAPEISRFLETAGGVVLLAAYAEWRRGSWRLRDWDGTALLIGFALTVFMAFKAGFVRHDIHTLIAWSTLTAAAPICASRQIRVAPDRRWALGMLAVCIFAAAATLSARQEKTGQAFWPFIDSTFGSGVLDRAVAAAQTFAGTRLERLRDDRERALATLRNADPLPPLGGTVDIYPWDAALPLAYGMDYRPRPVFQSYVAYSGSLMSLNRQHLQSGAAADKTLFAIETLDNRFPSLDDAEAWPELLARYDARGMLGKYLLLQRRAVPRQIEYRDLGTVDARWSRRIEVPQTPGLLWASIEIDRTAGGALMNVLFKVPAVGMAVQLADGRGLSYRLVPAIARDGFLLSPIVDSTGAFAALARGEVEHRIAAIELRRPSEATPYYADAIRVTFRSLEIR